MMFFLQLTSQVEPRMYIYIYNIYIHIIYIYKLKNKIVYCGVLPVHFSYFSAFKTSSCFRPYRSKRLQTPLFAGLFSTTYWWRSTTLTVTTTVDSPKQLLKQLGKFRKNKNKKKLISKKIPGFPRKKSWKWCIWMFRRGWLRFFFCISQSWRKGRLKFSGEPAVKTSG